MIVLMLDGCSIRPEKESKRDGSKPPEAQVPSQKVHIQQGNFTEFTDVRNAYDLAPKHEAIWAVRWQEGNLDYVQGEKPGGDMKQVEGTIYQRGIDASAFSSDRGHAEQGTGVLSLDGNVHVKSLARQSKGGDLAIDVAADSVVWDQRKKVVVAKGNVSLRDKGYTLEGISELWCSPDLKYVSTPDLYKTP